MNNDDDADVDADESGLSRGAVVVFWGEKRSLGSFATPFPFVSDFWKERVGFDVSHPPAECLDDGHVSAVPITDGVSPRDRDHDD